MLVSAYLIMLVMSFSLVQGCMTIRMTTTIDETDHQLLIKVTTKQPSTLVIFSETVLRRILRNLDLLVCKRDWTINVSRVVGQLENGLDVKLLATVHGNVYDLPSAFLAVDYPIELPTPIYPIVSVDDGQNVIEYQIRTRDWRRYLKSNSMDIEKLYRTSPNTHTVHISPTEHQLLVEMFSPFRLVKVKAATDIGTKMGHFYPVTTVDYRDRLVNLAVAKEDENIFTFLEKGLDREEASEAYLCLHDLQKTKKVK